MSASLIRRFTADISRVNLKQILLLHNRRYHNIKLTRYRRCSQTFPPTPASLLHVTKPGFGTENIHHRNFTTTQTRREIRSKMTTPPPYPLTAPENRTPPKLQDGCSCSNMLHVGVVHTKLNWVLDFDKHQLNGSVVHRLRFWQAADFVQFDGRDLQIQRVTRDGKDLQFAVSPQKYAPFGQAIRVDFCQVQPAGSQCEIEITYETSARASALQWLQPQQTADKQQPFLFSQCQAIHARSILPCMDAPAVKFTYEATVSSPESLVVLMSAVSTGKTSSGTTAQYTFAQKVPISSYLLAIVAGHLAREELSDRCAVWAEPSVVKLAAYDFAETEKMVQAAEALLGPYVWGRYDLLVLPPAFPYGGMENPCLTFVTPTLLTGDRSLADVVAHEAAHSWTGNLVTNATWGHFWLNEGNTMFVERKILQRLTTEADRQFDAYDGYHGRLRDAVYEQFSPTHPYTCLVLGDMSESDPDDTFSTVPYEKGHSLLFYLEQQVGGPAKFEPFLRDYIAKFAYGTVTTDEWKRLLLTHFPQLETTIDWQKWLYEPGMPPVDLQFDQTLAAACRQLAHVWQNASPQDIAAMTADPFNALSTLQKVQFLTQLRDAEQLLTPDKLAAMDALYGLSATTNNEVLFSWIRLCIKCRWPAIIDVAIRLVTSQGRMKYCRPIYRDLNGWAEARPHAVEAFQANRSALHEIAATMVAKDLGFAG